ncbi:DNA polymerase subunit Cdc27-domain-containing protein [Suillus ampliporus]|nr:DNA polymerase subunit Cdc27-domain-containing protein [Suillus ampliporus]
MTSTRAKDFLTKELFIKKNVVTFRSLSRELGIHVNDAKNELAAYLAKTANTDTPSFATYMVSGQIAPLYTSESLVDAMDYIGDSEDTHQSVMRSKIVLVDCDGLQDAKAQFERIHSVYIYSLSPSVLRDAGLICQPTVDVRNIDAKGNSAFNGKIISAHVKVVLEYFSSSLPSHKGMQTKKGLPKNASIASSSKTTLDAPKPVVPQSSIFPRKSEETSEKGRDKEEPKDKEHAKSLGAPKERPKPTGKLDWSKSRSKEQETASGAHVKDQVKPQPKQDPKTSSSSAKLTDKPSGNRHVGPLSMKKSISKVPAVEPKRATKRKSPDPSDSDADIKVKPTPKDKKAIPPATSNARVKKGVIMSDDEDEEAPIKSRKKITRSTSDTEGSLAAMMDIDDDQVVRASRLSSRHPDDVVDDSGDEVDQTDVDLLISSAGEEEEEEDPKPQAKKRKSRKVVPVGRNGLKKHRVMKSRTTVDAKGYMQTEDHSSYESVSEDEAAPEEPKKSKGKKKAEPKLKDEAEEKPVQATLKIKETNSSRGAAKTKAGKAPKRGGLLNFFGPDRSKK